jgi:N-acetylglucosamine kinase-like BadF-type ATPase
MKKYVIGVDGGGTKTHYALFDTEGNFIEIVEGGPSNHEHFKDGYDETKIILKKHIDILLRNNCLEMSDIDYAVFGLSGADVSKQYAELSSRISDIGVKRFKVCNDGFLGVKAGSKKGFGICSINGTGHSCAAIDKNGNWLQIGGTGYMFGDAAGGGYLAEMLVKSVYDSFFRGGKKTVMTKMLFEALGITSENELVEAIYNITLKNKLALTGFSRFAFYAANEGDEVALELLRYIGNETAKAVIGAIRRLDFGSEEIDVVMAGSLYVKGENPALVDTFKQEILSAVDQKIRFTVLNVPPVMGAVLWAIEEANGRFDTRIREKALASLITEQGHK